MEFDDLPEGWEVWNAESRAAVLTFRPDVFDTEAYPAPCLPTIHLTKGRRGRRPGPHTPAPDDPWYVTLYLEPEVEAVQRSFDSPAGAESGAVRLAGEFANGGIDYREAYQVPRPAYLDRLDELTGAE